MSYQKVDTSYLKAKRVGKSRPKGRHSGGQLVKGLNVPKGGLLNKGLRKDIGNVPGLAKT